jgi:hypothetical protein
MAATVTIDEGHGTNAATISNNITNSNMGSSDTANLDPVAYPITAGQNSYEKWQRFNVTAMGGSSAIKNLKVWRTGALGGSDTHLTNARESGYTTAGTGTTPVATSSAVATQTMPTTTPTNANLGIGGSLTGQLTATGTSDWLVHQIQVNAASTAGTTTTMNYQYDEIA